MGVGGKGERKRGERERRGRAKRARRCEDARGEWRRRNAGVGSAGRVCLCVLLSKTVIFFTSKFTCKFTSKILLVNFGKFTSWETRKKTLWCPGLVQNTNTEHHNL